MAMKLTVEQLSYVYPGGAPALSELAFQVEEGDRLALIGPNGAGKTTLLLVMAGLIGKGGVTGAIRWEPSLPVRGFLFQNPDDQIVGATVADDVGFNLLKQGKRDEVVKRRVGEVLKDVHLDGYQGRYPLEMSFGEKKRMALAGLFVGNPDILFLDEPALGLDPREASGLVRILNGFSGTVIFSSMDFEVVERLADRVVLLDGGKIVADTVTPAVLSDRRLLEKHGLIFSIDG